MVAHRVHCPKTAFESHDCNGHEGVPSRGMTDFDRTHPKFCSIRTQILLISRGEIMSKIYKIVNDINDKIYIGKTNSTIEKRFKEHCADSTRRDEENRPLYRAMNKYGVEHFSIHLIEECSDDEASAREQYWIGFYKGYTEGYNATLGEDGKTYIDISELLRLWSLGKTLKEIAEITCHDKGWISILLKENGINGKDIVARSQEKKQIQVQMLDKNTNELLQTFSSTREAARWIIETQGLAKSSEGGYSSHISEVCNGKRKSCSGYKWQYTTK